MKNITSTYLSLLRHLAGLGKAAEKQIARLQNDMRPEWDSLYTEFVNAAADVISDVSTVDYRRWTERLSSWAVQRGIVRPEQMSAENADTAFRTLYNGNFRVNRKQGCIQSVIGKWFADRRPVTPSREARAPGRRCKSRRPRHRSSRNRPSLSIPESRCPSRLSSTRR